MDATQTNDITMIRDGFSVACTCNDGLWSYILTFEDNGETILLRNTDTYATHNAAFMNAKGHYARHCREAAQDDHD